ncbi:MAG: DUF4145 domain-containing protein [Clostridia bacterium]|nr:DUF4145 domain-containing protein [Clostridia bacterium]
MTNFDFLRDIPEFRRFAESAISAELLLHIDRDACAFSVRRVVEFAVKWMFTADADLKMPYNDSLSYMLDDHKFTEIVGEDIKRRLEFVRKHGNKAAHDEDKVTYEQAVQCLENLFVFVDFLACCYIDNYVERDFDSKLLELTVDEVMDFVTVRYDRFDIEALIEENKALRENLAEKRAEHVQSYVAKPYEY